MKDLHISERRNIENTYFQVPELRGFEKFCDLLRGTFDFVVVAEGEAYDIDAFVLRIRKSPISLTRRL